MRIHVQNAPTDSQFIIDEAMWQLAAARASVPESAHVVSYGSTPEALVAGLADAEALITPVSEIAGRCPLPGPSLKLIFCLSAGVEKLAPFDWLPPHVTLMNNRGAHGIKAGEFAIMAILMLANGMPELIGAQQAQHWAKRPASVLGGRRLTVIGVGGLGGAAAHVARRFGLHITGVRNRAEPHPDCDIVVNTSALDEVLPQTEFLVIACPLTPQTHNLIDRRRFERLPQGAGVINIGRGKLIDQDAICDLLDSGHLGGAVLDVFTPEPVPAGHRLWTTRNLVMTPHCSSDDPLTYNPRSLDLFFANLAAWQEHRPMPNRVDPLRHY